MFWNLKSVKKFHCKPVYCKQFTGFKITYPKCGSISIRRSDFHSATPVFKFSGVNNFKNVQKLLKGSTINDLVVFRNISTSSVLLNEEKNSKKDDRKKDEDLSQKKKGFILNLILWFLILYFWSRMRYTQMVPVQWEDFKSNMLAKRKVEKIYLNHQSLVAIIKLYQDETSAKSPEVIYWLSVPDPVKFEEKLRETEMELGIPVNEQVSVEYLLVDQPVWLILLILLSLVGFIFHKIVFSNPQIKSQLKNARFGLWPVSKAKFTLIDPVVGQSKGVKFSDVAGLKEAKTEILDFVDYLKRPEVYRNLGAKIPKGALLLGPPGCGKTLLAKAVASEANVPFLSMNGSEFVEILGGLGAARVRNLFVEAKKRSPCIIYIDEIDCIGKKRHSTAGWGVNEEEQTLNQLLVEMDGIHSNEGVILLASTNRADILDKALCRPGRFDRQILIDFPTLEERKEMFELHLKNISLEFKPEVYSKYMAHLTPGFTGADIANVCNEAALHAARLKKTIVQGDDLEYALQRVIGGIEKISSSTSPQDKKMLAYYEAGRALIGWLSKYGEALLKISIVPRTHTAAGWSQFAPNEKFLYSSDDLRGKMCMGLGGRVALSVLFNRITTAGEEDLKKVTKLAYAQIRKFGMSQKFGLVSFDLGETDEAMKKPYSKALASVLDEEVRKLVSDVYKEAEKLLTENKDKLIKLAEELLKKETLSYDDVVKLLGPPLHKGKKLIEPLEFSYSLRQIADSEYKK